MKKIVALLAFASFMLSGCNLWSGSGNAQIAIKLSNLHEVYQQKYAQTPDDNEPFPIDMIEEVVVTVEGPGMTKIEETVVPDYENGVMRLSLSVPIGPERVFTIYVYAKPDRRLILEGRVVMNVSEQDDGKVAEVEIELEWQDDLYPDDCVPDCEGKVCGPDGCGGVCGSCKTTAFCDGASLYSREACREGKCVPELKEDCALASDECNLGACDANKKECVRAASNEGDSCGEESFCTTNKTCQSGECKGTPRDCSELDGLCVVGVCDEATKRCVAQNAQEGISCDDENDCTERDMCKMGVCVGTPKQEGAECDDGIFCTVASFCKDGVCKEGEPRDCSEFDGACSTGVCDEDAKACVANILPDDTECDDGNLCTVATVCINGSCEGTPKDCSAAGDQCNTGFCNPDDGLCIALPVADSSDCDDGLFCTETDKCIGGVCVGGASPDCSALTDIENCLQGVCNETAGACVAEAATDGMVCGEGLECRSGNCGKDDCEAASKQCLVIASPAQEKVQECAADASGFLKWADEATCASPTAYCDPVKYTCEACVTASHCPANTTDSCVSNQCRCGTGAPCAGGTPYCVGGSCVACRSDSDCGSGLVCSSGGACVECRTDDHCTHLSNQCRTGICDSNSCATTNKPNGTHCDDGDEEDCTGVCQSGSCKSGAQGGYWAEGAFCNDGEDNNPCTGVCNASGVCLAENRPSGTSCHDGSFCWIEMECTAPNDGGTEYACEGTVPRDCDDGHDCTSNYCNENRDTCEFTIEHGYCFINDECYYDYQDNPNNPCENCQYYNDPNIWTTKEDGYSCTHPDSCVDTAKCMAGTCQPERYLVCEGPCLTGECDPQQGCVEKAIGSPCESGADCIVNETCQLEGMQGEEWIACKSETLAPEGTPCGDNPCKFGMTCDASGQCSEATATTKPDGTPCYDGKWCENKVCQSGVCMQEYSRNCSLYTCRDQIGCDEYSASCGPPKTYGTTCWPPDVDSPGICDGEGRCIDFTCPTEGGGGVNSPPLGSPPIAQGQTLGGASLDRNCCDLDGCECPTMNGCPKNHERRLHNVVSILLDPRHSQNEYGPRGWWFAGKTSGILYLKDVNGTPQSPEDDKKVIYDRRDVWHWDINSMVMDRNHSLWVAHTGGLTYFNYNLTPEVKCDDIIAVYYNAPFHGKPVMSVGFDPRNANLWVAGDGLYYVNTNNTPAETLDDNVTEFHTEDLFYNGAQLPTNQHNFVFVTKNNDAFIGHENYGVSFIEAAATPTPASSELYTYNTGNSSLVHNNVKRIIPIVSDESILAVVTEGGVSIWDTAKTPHNGADDTWLNYTMSDIIANTGFPTATKVNDAYLERVHDYVFSKPINRLWILTDGGAAALNFGFERLSKADDTWRGYNAELYSPDVRSFASFINPVDIENHRFFGTADFVTYLNSGASFGGSGDDILAEYKLHDTLPQESDVSYLGFEQMDGESWPYLLVGGEDYLSFRSPNNSWERGGIYCEDRYQYWCAFNKDEDGLLGKVSSTATTDEDYGTTYIGANNGLYRVKHNGWPCDDKEYHTWMQFTNSQIGSGVTEVTTLFHENYFYNYMFIGTNNGLYYYKLSSQTFTKVAEIPSTKVTAVTYFNTENSYLLVGTESFGAYVIELYDNDGTLEIVGAWNYTIAHGLPSNTINTLILLSETEFAFGTNNGFALYNFAYTFDYPDDDLVLVYNLADGLPGLDITGLKFHYYAEAFYLSFGDNETVAFLGIGSNLFSKDDDPPEGNPMAFTPYEHGILGGAKKLIENGYSENGFFYSSDTPGVGYLEFGGGGGGGVVMP